MEKEKEKITVNMVNDRGASMMSISSIGRDGDQMTIVGSLLGAWESTMYLDPEELPKFIKLFLKKEVIGFIFSALFLINKRKKQPVEN